MRIETKKRILARVIKDMEKENATQANTIIQNDVDEQISVLRDILADLNNLEQLKIIWQQLVA